MWTHPSWRQPSRDRLRSYARHCNAVEGNTTFYATPGRAAVESWVRQTSPDFRFVVKFPRSITHERRLGDVDGELRAFLTAIEPLGPRAHTLWIQLPASFGPSDVGVLAGFLRRLPASYRYAVEVRHRAFFEQERAERLLERVLAGARAEWIPFDTTTLFATPPNSDAEREAWLKKPRVPCRSRALTDRPIVRYIGRDDAERTVEGWQRWVATAAEWLREGRTPTVFVHTPDNAEALALARRFHDDVRARVPDVEPLTEPSSEPCPAEPLSLF